MRIMLALVTAFVLLGHQPARAQQNTATFEEVRGEVVYLALPGPRADEERNVFVWRPNNAPDGPLPVLYMADGYAGIYVAIAHLREPILAGRLSPIMVVGMDAHPRRRLAEYVPSHSNQDDYEHHEAWFLNTVMPWAEGAVGAASNPRERAVGGFSNGADFALAVTQRHPELFGGVLAHSPVNWLTRYGDAEGLHNIRWVFTAGRREFNFGEIVGMIDRYKHAIGAAPIRRCVGGWGHEGAAWREVSPGSIAWLFQLPGAEAAQTETEVRACRNLPPN